MPLFVSFLTISNPCPQNQQLPALLLQMESKEAAAGMNISVVLDPSLMQFLLIFISSAGLSQEILEIKASSLPFRSLIIINNIFIDEGL